MSINVGDKFKVHTPFMDYWRYSLQIGEVIVVEHYISVTGQVMAKGNLVYQVNERDLTNFCSPVPNDFSAPENALQQAAIYGTGAVQLSFDDYIQAQSIFEVEEMSLQCDCGTSSTMGNVDKSFHSGWCAMNEVKS